MNLVRNRLCLLRIGAGHQPGLCCGGAATSAKFWPRTAWAGLWRRLDRPDGGAGEVGPQATAVRYTGIIPEFLVARERLLRRCAGRDRHPRHARAQAHDVREGRCLRRAAGRHRHAGGTGRAADLGAARAPQEADPDRQYRGLLGPALRSVRPYARAAVHPHGHGGATCWWPVRWRTSCRCSTPPPARSPRPRRK